MNIVKASDIEQPFRVAIVVSKTHHMITQRLYEAAIQRLNAHKIVSELITVIFSPTVAEIPLIAQSLAETDEIHAIIAVGAVIDNETPHAEYIAEQVSVGCQQVMLEYSIPLGFAVLTTDTETTALDMTGGAEGNAGHEAADHIYDTLSVLRQIAKLEFNR